MRSCQPCLQWVECGADADGMQLAAVQTEQGKSHETLPWSDRPALPSSLPSAADLPKWIKWFKASALCSAFGNTSCLHPALLGCTACSVLPAANWLGPPGRQLQVVSYGLLCLL